MGGPLGPMCLQRRTNKNVTLSLSVLTASLTLAYASSPPLSQMLDRMSRASTRVAVFVLTVHCTIGYSPCAYDSSFGIASAGNTRSPRSLRFETSS